eukprot:CAMPEP_0197863164 /NCGR_PEP_ID=MMETSP1438-20131217/40439_1 /TAXON_ID=1461541 /ORGANISM="Pterosperma sp., Strain CCMP1384" /LENGTH=142 /DNA_ID=CAMNT_0043480969 /DNA_START=106 /DNA_END=531 /DNA_ORIENTATION=+
MAPILGVSWQFFKTGVEGYETLEVRGEGDLMNRHECDGDDVNVELLMSQVMEFLITVVGNKRFKKMIQPHIFDLVYTSLQYMQMTSQQEEDWLDDAEQFLQGEENDMLSVRVSGEMLMCELATEYEVVGMQKILEAVGARIQ